MQSHFDTKSLPLRASRVTIDRPDSAQVDRRRCFANEHRRTVCHLAGGSSRLHRAETSLERSSESRGKCGDAKSGISWFCSVGFVLRKSTFSCAVVTFFQSAPENLPIHDLRKQILKVCEQDQQFPRDFIYLRSVGRCLTKVGRQGKNGGHGCIHSLS